MVEGRTVLKCKDTMSLTRGYLVLVKAFVYLVTQNKISFFFFFLPPVSFVCLGGDKRGRCSLSHPLKKVVLGGGGLVPK